MGSVSFAALMVAASAVADVQLLFFSSQACMPCQQVKPVVAQLAGQGYPIVSVDINQRADLADQGSLSLINELAVMAYLGMGIAVAIAALSLTVSTVASALDRRRTFGLLRLAGMPVRALRRTITVEAAVPLTSTLAGAAGLGFLVAWLMVTSLANDLTMGWPDARYWVVMIVSGAIAALAVASSFGMVRRSTEIGSTRFE